MNKSTLLCLLVITALTFVVTTTGTVIADDAIAEWTVDKERSSISFTSDAPAEKIVGTSEEVSGTIHWNTVRTSQTTAELSFPVDSMRTGNRLRDRHLTEEDWLNASEHPEVRFTVTGLEDVLVARSENRTDYRATAVGTVELNGVEHPNRASIEVAILPERKVARIRPKLEFRLADHEVRGADGAVGSEVGKVIEVEGLIYANWE